MKLAALYCVKNEEEFILLSIATVLPFVDELVIINNRSTDRTMELVRGIQHPRVKLVDIDSDFDEKCEFNMRNESLKYVSDDIDWIVVLDADQLLSDNWRNKVDEALTNPKCEALAVRYEHFVGSYEHVDKGLWQKAQTNDPPVVWIFFRRTPHLQCRPAAEVCSWAKPQHHASFERSCRPGSTFKCLTVRCFHYGFSKRNMMDMTLYRIHRGDYGHEPSVKAEMSARIVQSGNPFDLIGPVHPVSYGWSKMPGVMDPLLGHYKLELDSDGKILKRTIAATGEPAR